MTLPLWDDEPAIPETTQNTVAKVLIVEADGGSRGNPGLAAAGAVVIDPNTGRVIQTIGKFLGTATNNVAEYHGLIAGVKAALAAGASEVQIKMDSKLVVEQMSGRWKIKHPDMQLLAKEARTLLAQIPATFTWIPRSENSLADAAANRSMDTQTSFSEAG